MENKMMRRILSLLLCAALLLGSLPWLQSVGPALAAEYGASETAVSSENFAVHFIDVGQADAILVICEGKTMLIDGGNAADSNVIYTYLKNQGITHLDYMIGTHAHEDHIGGLPGALQYATVGTVLCAVTSFTTKAFQNFVTAVNNRGRSIQVPTVGYSFNLGSATCKVLAVNTDNSDVNNTSIVLRVVYGDTSFLFTGDAEKLVEESLINRGENLKADVLKVGHHGSGSSTSQAFVQKVAPKYAVISCGQDNEYGHPHDTPLINLWNVRATLFRTDLQGDIICTSDGKTVNFTVSRNANADVYGEFDGEGTNNGGNSGTTDPTVTYEQVTNVTTGQAYKLAVEQNNLGKRLYFAGKTTNKDFYLETTEDPASAADVYLEKVTGGYRMYFMNGATKTYIDLYKSGTYYNIRLTTSPTATYTYNTTYQTMVATVNGGSYYIGNYSSNAYLSCSKLSYAASSFPSHFYGAVQVQPEPTEPETTVPEGGLQYTIADGKVTITGYTGSESNLVIPQTIEGYPVTAIGQSAFYNCTALQSVQIPEGVTAIGFNAFTWCSNLTSVILPDSIKTVDGCGFYYCKKLNDLTIPEGVTAIGASAFAGCEALTNVIYAGSKTQWQSVSVGTGNDQLINNITFAKTSLVEQWNVSLEDDLKATFHVNVKQNDQVKISLEGVEVIRQASQLEKTADGQYIVSVNVAAAQMKEPITVQCISGGEVTQTAAYSIRQYADTLLEDNSYSAYHALLREMLNYGGMAQIYFDHHTHDLANQGLTGVGGAEIPEQAIREITYTGKADGLQFYAASLNYQDKVAVRFYFQTAADIGDYSFAAGDTVCQAVQKGQLYYVEVADILPETLDQQILMSVTDEDGDVLTVSYSPLNYMVRMNTKGSEELQGLLRALYNYHLAAKALRG